MSKIQKKQNRAMYLIFIYRDLKCKYLWNKNSKIAETWQEDFLINGDSKDVKTQGK